MNKTLGIGLASYGALLAALGSVVYLLAPAIGQPTMIAGLAGGALCCWLGLRAARGCAAKTWPVLILIPTTFVLLSQTILAWAGNARGVAGGYGAAVLMTGLLVASLGMLMSIAYAGVLPVGGGRSSGVGAK